MHNPLVQKILESTMIFFVLTACIYSVSSIVRAEVETTPQEVTESVDTDVEVPTLPTDTEEVPTVPEVETPVEETDIPENTDAPLARVSESFAITESVDEHITITAHKIVCDRESDLPNWGAGSSDIQETTAVDWVHSHPGCAFQSGWNFEWGNASAYDPGDTHIGVAGESWTTFGPTDASGMASTLVPMSALGESSHLWLREVLTEGFIPFTHDTNDNTNADDYSAEFYCHADVLNYDNFDRIDGVAAGSTYYCVAWNVRATTPDMCTVTLVSGTDENPTDAIDDATTVVEKEGALAKILSFVSPRWTASIPGASWIWGDNPVADPVDGVTQTFERTFGWNGPVTEATLYVAADDVYSSWINALLAGEDLNVANFKSTTQDEYDVTSLVSQGNNVLRFTVANDVNNTDPAKNPSGLLYKLVVSGTDPSCEVPYVPVVYGCTDEEASNYNPKATHDNESCVYEPTYTIFGYSWHDENENDAWEMNMEENEGGGNESSLAGWGITITNGTTTYTTVTDENGYYSFQVPAGTWTITEDSASGWSLTFPNVGSHVVTVPSTPIEESESIVSAIRDMFIQTAHAQVPVTYGPYNFGNTEVPSNTSGGGGGHRRASSSGSNTLSGVSTPVGEVLGESTSIMPVGAPNTGAGGTSDTTASLTFVTLLGMILSLGLIRVTHNGN